MVARRGGLGGGAAQLSRCRLARASGGEARCRGERRSAASQTCEARRGLAGLGQGGAGLEERLGQVGVEGAGALGLGEGGGGVVLVAQRGGEERVRQRVVGARGERGLERGLGGGPVGLGGGDAGEEDLAVGVGRR